MTDLVEKIVDRWAALQQVDSKIMARAAIKAVLDDLDNASAEEIEAFYRELERARTDRYSFVDAVSMGLRAITAAKRHDLALTQATGTTAPSRPE